MAVAQQDRTGQVCVVCVCVCVCACVCVCVLCVCVCVCVCEAYASVLTAFFRLDVECRIGAGHIQSVPGKNLDFVQRVRLQTLQANRRRGRGVEVHIVVYYFPARFLLGLDLHSILQQGKVAVQGDNCVDGYTRVGSAVRPNDRLARTFRDNK